MAQVALIEFDGADGATTASDTSGVGTKTITFFGAAAIRTAQSKYGGASLRTTGATGTYVTVASGAEMNFGTGDFSVQMWVRNNLTGVNGYPFASPNTGGLYLNFGSRQAAWGPSSILGIPPSPIVEDDNAFNAIGVSRGSGKLRLFINGCLYFVTPSTAAVDLRSIRFGTADPTIGVYHFDGYFDRFEAYDTCLWTTGYDPETLAPRASPKALYDPALLTQLFPRTWPAPTIVSNPLRTIRNIYYGGFGQLVGTVKRSDTPANVPLARKVRLFRDRDAVCVGETWSDATTGNYVFVGIDPLERYTVLARDHTGVFRAIVADNLLPTAYP